MTKKAVLIARCTESEKNQVHRQANKEGKSESKYILDCAIAGSERRTDKIKHMKTMQIELQEQINQLSYIVKDNKGLMDEKISKQLSENILKMELPV